MHPRQQMAYHQAVRLEEMGNGFRYNMHEYILYQRHEDTIFAILCTDLPITATLVGQWLNSLIIFNGDIKCITTNGQMIIYVTNYICHMMIIHFVQKNWEVLSHSYYMLMVPCSITYCSNSMPIWLHCNYVIHSVHK